MLCYNGLGDDAKANEHKTRYLRFKADESSQAITGPYREGDAEDNNERQPIHEHFSVALGSVRQRKSAAGKVASKIATQDNVRTGGGKEALVRISNGIARRNDLDQDCAIGCRAEPQ